MKMSAKFRVLRVEETPAAAVAEGDNVVTEAITATLPVKAAADDVQHWRKMAISTAERLSIAENQLKDLRSAADEARARFGKYKDRLDKAQALGHEQQVEIVRLAHENETLKQQLADRLMEKDATIAALNRSRVEAAKYVHAFRQSLLDGPLWEAFTELAVGPPQAGEEHR